LKVKFNVDSDSEFIIHLLNHPYLHNEVLNMPVERLSIKDENQLLNMVSKELETLEKGLTTIANNVPIDEKTKIGLLCHDEEGQLVIVCATVEPNHEVLFNAIKCLDFVEKFKPMLSATHPKSKIDIKKPPRLILLAPEYPEEILNIAKKMKDVQIHLYTWEYLKIGDSKGFHFEPIFIPTWTWKPEKKKKEEKPPKEKKKEPKEEKPKEEEKEKEEPPVPKPQPEPRPEPEPEPIPPPIKPVEEPKPKPVEFEEKKKKEGKKKLKLF